ncbi:MAG: hypothetical protein ACOC56_05255 [Atribacterota bacterium]
MELFDYLRALTNENKELDFNNDEIRKGYNPYIINRFVSMSEVFVPVVNEINEHEVPKDVHYRFMFSILPKRKQYFKYIKKNKDLSLKEKKVIAHYFEVGLKEAEEYIRIMQSEQIQEVLEIYRSGKNKIIDV